MARILSKIQEQAIINFDDNNEEEKAKLIDLLNLLSYPDCEDEEMVNKIFEQDKRAILPVLYFLLANFEPLKKRGYLGYYLVPLNIPNEFMVDSEMKGLYEEYKELVELFRGEHESYEKVTGELPDKDRIKEEVSQLENERDQLKIKLKTYKHEKTEKADFQELLAATTKLRKAQEEEAQLYNSFRYDNKRSKNAIK